MYVFMEALITFFRKWKVAFYLWFPVQKHFPAVWQRRTTYLCFAGFTSSYIANFKNAKKSIFLKILSTSFPATLQRPKKYLYSPISNYFHALKIDLKLHWASWRLAKIFIVLYLCSSKNLPIFQMKVTFHLWIFVHKNIFSSITYQAYFFLNFSFWYIFLFMSIQQSCL